MTEKTSLMDTNVTDLTVGNVLTLVAGAVVFHGVAQFTRGIMRPAIRKLNNRVRRAKNDEASQDAS